MGTDLLSSLRDNLDKATPVSGLEMTDDGLRGTLGCQYGEVTLQVDHDPEAEAIRVSARTPPPPGAGPEFLIWCLALNAQYWDVKLALDEDGLLLVHADVDADSEMDATVLGVAIGDRVDTMVQLLDDDLCGYLTRRRLGTPTQLERWEAASSAASQD